VPEVSFRTIPEGGEDSCTFISWFLPTEEITKAFVAEMKAQNILAGNFYWYANNWHYIKQWQHLKEMKSLHNINEEQKAALAQLQDQDFSASDAVMSRCISTAISLLWTEEQIKEKGEKMVAAIKKALNEVSIGA
jgi:8-amino-3,8-dideoxy-alpha-D-manno-octulosonate transaminase